MLRLSSQICKQSITLQRLPSSINTINTIRLQLVTRKMTQQHPKIDFTTSIPIAKKNKDKITALGWFLLVSKLMISLAFTNCPIAAHTRHDIWPRRLASEAEILERAAN